MKISRWFAIGFVLWQGVAMAQMGAAESELTGRYFLKDVREMGGELVLSRAGRFQFGVAYGGTDLVAEGAWSVSGGKLTLRADSPPPPSLTLGEKRDQFSETPEKPILLDVKVVSPRLGLRWSNMVISAEFSNGLSRSGTTGRSGGIAFLIREDGDWRGATIRKVSVAYPNGKVAPVWFDVNDSVTKELIVHFDPGTLAPPPFQTLELSVERGSHGGVALVQRGAEGPSLVFEK